MREQGAMDRNDLPLEINKIKGRLYLVEDYNYWKSNHVFYLHPEGVVFFDTTWSYKGARQLLWQAAVLSQAPFHGVVITSFLLPHTGGLAPFQASAVPIIMHKTTPALLKKYWQQEQEKMTRDFSTWRRFDHIKPNALFGKKFHFFNRKIEVIHVGPAHTPDSSVILFPDERLLYAGSLLSNPLQRLKYIDLAGYELALRQIESLPFDTIIAGHGIARHDRQLLKEVQLQIKRLKKKLRN